MIEGQLGPPRRPHCRDAAGLSAAAGMSVPPHSRPGNSMPDNENDIDVDVS